mmetsp:Transcript_12754/g.24201  ORF Transcript_12754/g.24201 Transcript_12754/m.24201 type:complete len:396 (+) Transcript_12754:373-1560(+)|eukprot:CAMPEP_0114235904 /NCGR_PEP_ID=MMETSP0058-20121206/6511_1 /TAXON_ID=36894 /ORGANISM="Pyramimonas parkeae, CCMP726" /LENGTH=395 /DNA_ID=CAMNT_0001347721 /DNA_START=373 /DNA_END=1560 /DNA_ORIENTATION=-
MYNDGTESAVSDPAVEANSVERRLKYGDREVQLPNKNAPKNNRFTQQELPACRPLMTPRVVTVGFFLVGILFVPLGAIVLAASSSVVEQSKRYDNEPECTENAPDRHAREANLQAQGGNGISCVVLMKIEEDMKAPVYFYYQLHNYYQNHRRYVKSRSDKQLRGEDPDEEGFLDSLGLGSNDLDDCIPQKERTVDEGDGSGLEEGQVGVINPCGLIAWSYFNDTYSFTILRKDSSISANEPLLISTKGIAWDSDKNNKFGHYTTDYFNNETSSRGGGTVDGYVDEDEHFIVWMRTATLPTFRKLWGKFDTDFKKGDVLRVKIDNRYNTYRFDGQKKIVLSTTSWLGGKNDFLGIAYVVVGIICMLLGLVFLGIHVKNPRPLGEASSLNWNPRSAE